jgi:lactoylglutathione lyase
MPVKTNLKISTISYAIVYVRDTAKSVSFYRDVLGAKVKVDSPGWVEFDMGATTLALHSDTEFKGERRNSVVVVFPVDNIDKAYEELKAAGVKIVTAPHQVCEAEDTVGVSCDFEVPDGNLLSFYGNKKK